MKATRLISLWVLCLALSLAPDSLFAQLRHHVSTAYGELGRDFAPDSGARLVQPADSGDQARPGAAGELDRSKRAPSVWTFLREFTQGTSEDIVEVYDRLREAVVEAIPRIPGGLTAEVNVLDPSNLLSRRSEVRLPSAGQSFARPPALEGAQLWRHERAESPAMQALMRGSHIKGTYSITDLTAEYYALRLVFRYHLR